MWSKNCCQALCLQFLLLNAQCSFLRFFAQCPNASECVVHGSLKKLSKELVKRRSFRMQIFVVKNENFALHCWIYMRMSSTDAQQRYNWQGHARTTSSRLQEEHFCKMSNQELGISTCWASQNWMKMGHGYCMSSDGSHNNFIKSWY